VVDGSAVPAAAEAASQAKIKTTYHYETSGSAPPSLDGAFSFREEYNQRVEKQIENVEGLRAEARELLARLAPGEGATLVTLSGELGAGKTTFAQQIAGELGVTDHVTSPTFVLEKIYELAGSSFKKLVHIDAYRLNSGTDLKALGFDEIMKDAENLVLLEWPERVSDTLPPATVSITLVPNSDGTRTLTYA
jgi:tRNA threonylcarbamoyladenosine biosynthesis protein TsaE